MMSSNIKTELKSTFPTRVALVVVFITAAVTLRQSWYEKWDVAMTDLTMLFWGRICCFGIVEELSNFGLEKPLSMFSRIHCMSLEYKGVESNTNN